MTKAILSVGALLAAAVALAGCGGSGSGSAGGTIGTTAGTTSGVAGASTTKTAHGGFSATVHGFTARLQTSVKAFENGNVSAAASSGGSLLANCTSTVNNKLAPHAMTNAQRKAVTHLRVSCSDMSKAAQAGGSGNMTKAKQFAQAALKQAQIAAKLSG